MSIERHPLFIRPKLELCREIDRLRAELANLKALLKDICDEWSEDCDPGCDSVAHTEHCKAQNIAEAKRAMREENERLRAELAECRRDNERLSEIGLITADALRLIGEGKPVPFQWMQKKLAALVAGRENNDGNA